MNIYRVILDPKLWADDSSVDIFYPIGSSKTYTGFFTTSLKDAKNILSFLHESYFIDTAHTEYEYPAVIIQTTIDNCVTLKDFKHLKTYHNILFDENELFVTEIKDFKLIKILEVD